VERIKEEKNIKDYDGERKKRGVSLTHKRNSLQCKKELAARSLTASRRSKDYLFLIKGLSVNVWGRKKKPK